jgi:hypothetical protein
VKKRMRMKIVIRWYMKLLGSWAQIREGGIKHGFSHRLKRFA